MQRTLHRTFQLALASLTMLMATPAFAQRVRDHHRTPSPRDHRHRAHTAPGPDGSAVTPPRRGPSEVMIVPRRGPAGSTVTLRGMFPDGAGVTFDGRPVKLLRKARGNLAFAVPVARPGRHAIVILTKTGHIDAGWFELVVPPSSPPTGTPPQSPPTGTPPQLPPTGMPPATAHGSTAGHTGHRGWWREHRNGMTVASFAPASGPPGTIVTIRGKRFAPNVQVVFGNQPLPLRRKTKTVLQFKVPKAVGSQVLRLRVAGRPDQVVGTFDVGAKKQPNVDNTKRWRTEAQRTWAQRKKQLAKNAAARKQALIREQNERRASRAKRRKARIEQLQAKWQRAFLSLPEAQTELSLHAQRMARLDRMRQLAEANASDKLVIRIGVLVRQEDARHNRRMTNLKTAYSQTTGGHQ